MFLTAALIAASALPTLAQVSSGASERAQTRHGLCLRERLRPDCNVFLVFEVGPFVPLRTTVRRVGQTGQMNGAFGPHWAWDLGIMRKASASSAVGVAGEAGFSGISYRLAIEPRYRHWLPGGFSVDAAAGPLWTHVGSVQESGGAGVTADVRINFRDYIGLIGRADALHTAEFGNARAVYAGLAVRDKSAVVTTGVLVGALLLLIGLGTGANGKY